MFVRFLTLCGCAGLAAFVWSASPHGQEAAQEAAQGGAAKRESESWDVTKPRGATREIDFVTSEGTWMSVDLSADGKWIVFDLLGHVYRVAAAGGEAECLTQSSGVAV